LIENSRYILKKYYNIWSVYARGFSLIKSIKKIRFKRICCACMIKIVYDQFLFLLMSPYCALWIGLEFVLLRF
jgi:hypothetical protein